MTLHDELTTGPLAAEMATFLAIRNDAAIAEIYNRGRTKLVETHVGNLTVVGLLGIEDGNRLLDAIYSNADYRYVTDGLKAARLDISDPLVRAALDAMAMAGVITTPQADLLKNLAVVPDPVSVDAVSAALNRGI
jgi:hypothetical protein